MFIVFRQKEPDTATRQVKQKMDAKMTVVGNEMLMRNPTIFDGWIFLFRDDSPEREGHA
jgi:hypothetical protein